MTLFQLMMLGASAYFAFEIYKHIQTLKEPEKKRLNFGKNEESEERSAEAFSTFSPEYLVDKADKSFEEKEYEKALALLVEANAKEPNNPEILFKLGFISHKNGENQKAIVYYKELLEIDENDEYTHNAMASIYRENREFTSAKIHLKKSLDIDNTNPITYYNYGNLLVDTESFEEAMDMYEKAIELNPNFEEAKEELVTLKEKS